jgi:hypothetical protein
MNGTRILSGIIGVVAGALLGWKGADVAADVVAATSGIEVNGWTYSIDWGVAKPPSLRAAAYAKHYMLANTAEEAVYYLNRGDTSDGKQLLVHFNADQIPDVQGFWSLTMYHGTLPYNLVKNPIDRFVISLRTPGVKLNDDGSFDVYIQHNAPSDDRVSNWLPAPDGPYVMAVRTYWPGEAIVEGRYAPPPVEVINESAGSN